MKILLIEDNERLTEYVRDRFAASEISLDVTRSVEEGLRTIASADYDACIVDRVLDGPMDGLEFVAQLRSRGSSVPILVLSALADVQERIKGLQTGADDYLAKPFDFDELYARILALRRRRSEPPQAIVDLRVADLAMDLRARIVRRGQSFISLQPLEFRVLEFLLRHCGQVVTRRMLLEQVWEYGFDPGTNVIDVQISKLRGKIDAGYDRPLLHTVRSVGYMLSDAR